MATHKMNRALKAAVLAGAIMVGLSLQANAGTLTGGATEWTQIANNIQLVESYMKQVQSARNTLDSARALQQQLQQIDPGTLNQLTGGSINQVQQLAELDRVLESNAQSSQRAIDVLRNAMAQGQAQGVDPAQYLQARVALAQSGSDVAQKNLASDQRALQDLQNQVAELRRSADSAHGVTSNIQGFQQLLASGNRTQAQLVAINHSIVEANARAAMKDEAAAEKEKAADDARQKYADSMKKDAATLRDEKISVPNVSKYADTQGH